MSSQNQTLRVAHYHPVWLPQTMTWLYRQVSELEQYCENTVICEETTLLDQFNKPYIRSFSECSVLMQFVQRLLKKTGFRASIPFYINTLKDSQSQLLHSHFGHIAVVGTEIALELNIPHVVSFYGMDIHQVPKSDPSWLPAYSRMLEHTKMVLCEGQYMAKSIVDLGCYSDKVKVHHLGIDLENISHNPRKYNKSNILKILIAGSFREKKGIPLALNAIAQLHNRNNIRVTIVGDASNDVESQAEKKRILDTISSQKLEDIVDLKGFLSHTMLNEIAADHHIFLSPSIHAKNGDCEGGAPVSIIEMAASGMLVVSSTHCDIPGVIKHGESGFLAQEDDLDDLVSQLETAITSTERWLEMQNRARKHIETHFDARKQAEKLASLYKEVIRE
jgi:colanic acid/amylovoran biosynthesis glycosyltransferase